jgi:hypothetical protein
VLLVAIKSDFLMGVAKPTPGYKQFVLKFDWLIINDTNYLKILEGNYTELEGN